MIISRSLKTEKIYDIFMKKWQIYVVFTYGVPMIEINCTKGSFIIIKKLKVRLLTIRERIKQYKKYCFIALGRIKTSEDRKNVCS